MTGRRPQVSILRFIFPRIKLVIAHLVKLMQTEKKEEAS